MTYRLLVIVLLTVAVSACATTSPLPPAQQVVAIAETPPVGARGDAADDPALFIGAAPALSRVIGTQKDGGLYVYDLEGRLTQDLPGGLPNNVDLREGFAWPDGDGVIVATSDRADNALGLYRFDAAVGRLEPTARARIATGWAEVYGVCLGRVEGALVALATSKTGEAAVWSLEPGPEGPVFTRTISFALGSIAEGCAIDDATGAAYVSQELVGVWRVDLRDPDSRRLIDRVGEGRLVADVEGIAIARGPGAGYLIVSTQAADQFAVYDLRGENRYRGSFTIAASLDGRIDGVSHTDGVDVAMTGPGAGLIVAQDDENTHSSAAQNFKFARWEDVVAVLGLE